MAKMAIDFHIDLEKISPKSAPSRRFSTGNEIIKISAPLPIPNYLRASIGSCHDFCKYGAKRHVSPESTSTKHDKIASVVTNKALGKKKLVPVPSSRQQPSESKPKPLVRSDQSSSLKQLHKPLWRSTKNVQTCHDHAGKGTRSVSLANSSLPRSSGKESLFQTCHNTSSGKEFNFRRSGKNTSSTEKDAHLEIKKSNENAETFHNTSSGKESLFWRSGKNTSFSEKDTHLEIKKSVENSKTWQNTSSGTESLSRRADKSSLEKDSCMEIKKSVENSETCQKTRYENVPEKIIHVVEPNDENRDEDVASNESCFRGLVSSPKQKQKLDSEAKSRNRGVGIGKVVPKESDSSSRKLKIIKNGKALEIGNVDTDSKGKSLRRVVSEGETADPEKNVTMRGALRRKAITQKTTNQELMNATIEETAGKLSSKSKVKALVDAFETLITFQDFGSPSACARSV